MSEKNNNCGFASLPRFYGEFSEMERRLRYIEKMRAVGYHLCGLVVKCNKCENSVFLDSVKDLYDWRNGKRICDSCKIHEHYSKTRQEREKAEAENREFFEKLAACKTNEDFDALISECERKENRFAPRVQQNFYEKEL